MEKDTNSNRKIRKKAFIDTFKNTFGNVSQTCKVLDLDRSTYYRWLKDDEDFKIEIESVEPKELFLDFTESKLVEKISGGDTTAIIFTLKTKGKSRGYIERKEIEHQGGIENTLIEWKPSDQKE
tara:strand:- start:878 stop:1249 length:372 start_codon:yes stop_codon:yes gene_type:complete